MSINEINYYPGHMQKALGEIKEKLKNCDGVIEVMDLRGVKASFPLNLDDLIVNKIKVAVLTKEDIADKKKANNQIAILKEKGFETFTLDVRNVSSCSKLLDKLSSFKTKKDEKYLKLGFPMTKKRYMILGIPNVGKSTLINSLCKKYKTAVENRPGKTRSETLIQVSKYVEIYDTPGILRPNYEDKTLACQLALLGSIKIDSLNKITLSDYLFDFLKKEYPSYLINNYKLNEDIISKENEEILSIIAKNRNFILNSSYDIERARDLVLKDFRNGNIGRISFDEYTI